MLDKLKDLVKHYAGEPIINNSDIPNERNEEVVEEASSSIFKGLKDAVSGGNVSDLTDLLKGGDQDISQAPLTQNIQGGFIESLTKKFGLDHGKASQIAASLIPVVMKKFASRTNDPADNHFDLTKMITGFTGGESATGPVNTNFKQDDTSEDGLIDKVKGLFK
ncbi:hypothetical protein EXU57_12230 [Segetibacter sp. 3557_3]|uniref:DUF937 domain-containing protein n=1 Tax=Segetibacter sp. 3557_3 TaxID=2547429 RepID=UPI0010587E52|nr:DUF937 domain-containing protein [Segetibacter sp. 3557_3]TDH26249.1 hypothetical protein EXU57_12230 [Segetibacter sp. 3557_3]